MMRAMARTAAAGPSEPGCWDSLRLSSPVADLEDHSSLIGLAELPACWGEIGEVCRGNFQAACFDDDRVERCISCAAMVLRLLWY